jgi:hypothetical protein
MGSVRDPTQKKGKHRTEVTEATEGDWEGTLGKSWLACENYAEGGKHRTGITEATEGDSEGTFGKIVAPVRELREGGIIAESSPGGIEVGSRPTFCNS